MAVHVPRRPGRPGLSVVDANEGRLVTYEQDVLDIKAEILATWPGLLNVYFDKWSECWVITQFDRDGTESLAFTTEVLSQATIDKIHRCDQASRSYVDPEEAYQKADKEEERAKDWNLSEAVGQAAERLYHGLRKDGIIDRPQVYFSNRVGDRTKR